MTRKGEAVIDSDEQPRTADHSKNPNLKPAFARDGTVTPANSSSIKRARINPGAISPVADSSSIENAVSSGSRPRMGSGSGSPEARSSSTTTSG